MMTPEESRVLAYLCNHASAAVAEVARACLPGASHDWLGRLLGNLEWLGYVTVFHGAGGEPALLQLTETGKAYCGVRAVAAVP